MKSVLAIPGLLDHDLYTKLELEMERYFEMTKPADEPLPWGEEDE